MADTFDYRKFSDYAEVSINNFGFVDAQDRAKMLKDPEYSYNMLEMSGDVIPSKPFDEPFIRTFGETSVTLDGVSDAILRAAKTMIDIIPNESDGFGKDASAIRVEKGPGNTNAIEFYMDDPDSDHTFKVGEAEFNVAIHEDVYGQELPNGRKVETMEFLAYTWDKLEEFESLAREADEFTAGIDSIAASSDDLNK